MFEMFNFNRKHVYPVLVVSTMSSGKSTLINALIGRELLPSRNSACTARAAAVLNDDDRQQFRIHIVDGGGRYRLVEEAEYKAAAEFEWLANVDEMIIEGSIPGISNRRKAVMLIDTPGLNYCLDESHAMITREVLKEYQKGLILYVINAQQIGTYDDRDSLKLIVNKLKDAPDFNVIFVINKMDKIDPDRENPGELVEQCRKYIQGEGIEKPMIIPVSAGSAIAFRKILNQESLSQEQEEDFERSYRRFKRSGYSLTDYVSIPECRSGSEILTVGSGKYTRAEIRAALDHTGLPYLEKKIDRFLTDSLKVEVPEIKVKKSSERKKSAETKKAEAAADRQEKRAEKKMIKEKTKAEKKEQKKSSKGDK